MTLGWAFLLVVCSPFGCADDAPRAQSPEQEVPTKVPPPHVAPGRFERYNMRATTDDYFATGRRADRVLDRHSPEPRWKRNLWIGGALFSVLLLFLLVGIRRARRRG